MGAGAFYHVAVLDVGAKRATLRVTVMETQSQGFLDDADFTLRLLLDAFEGQEVDAPLAQEELDYSALSADAYIESVEVSVNDDGPDDPDDIDAMVEEVMEGQLIDWPDDPETAAFLPRLPNADYSVVAADPKWLSHLEPGAVWSSAAYSD